MRKRTAFKRGIVVLSPLKLSVTAGLVILLTGVLFAGHDWSPGDKDPIFLSDFTEPAVPEIVSSPPQSIELNADYIYQVEATDPYDYPLTYRLVEGPDGMAIDSRHGLLEWHADRAGTFSVDLEVRNPRGGTAQQSYQLTAQAVGELQVLSDPVTLVPVGETYSYQPVIMDPNELPLTFTLLDAPPGMTIDAGTGLLQWQANEPGMFAVSWRVENTLAQQAEQSFDLSVAEVSELGQVRGQVSGLEAPWITIRENTTGQVRTLGNHSLFSFDLLIGQPYQVEILEQSQSSEQTCVIDNASGLMTEADLRPVFVICLPLQTSIDDLIAEAEDEMNSGLPPTTPEEFEASEFGQNQMAPADRARRDRAHALVMSAIDPDPEWVSTWQSDHLILAQAGQTYHVDLRRLDFDGNEIGPVPPDFLRLEIRVQRDDYDYEWIHESLGTDIAHWTDVDGQLSIRVPDDLERGRVIVGVRPDFFDPGQRAIAERWSAAVLLEVWPLQASVSVLDDSSVLYPADPDSEQFPDGLEYSREEVRDLLDQVLADGDFVLPLLLSDLGGLGVGDLFDYRLAGQIYGGRVSEVHSRNGTHLLLVRPEWPEVYDIPGAEENFLVDQGVLPEHVVFRQGDPVEGFDTPWRGDRLLLALHDEESGAVDRIVFPSDRNVSRDNHAWFLGGCGQSSGTLTFSPYLSLSPSAAGIDVTVGSAGGISLDCKWTANGRWVRTNIMRVGGPLVWLFGELVGTEVRTRPFGEIGFKTGVDGLMFPGLSGFKAGFGTKRGAYIDLGLPTDLRDLNDLANGTPTVAFFKGGVGGGIQQELNIVSARGWIGRLLRVFGIRDIDFGLDAKIGLELGAVFQGANAPAVYRNGADSKIASTSAFSASVSPSSVIQRIASYLGGKGEIEIEWKIEGIHRFAGKDFNAGGVKDDGRGHARIGELTALPGLTAFFGIQPRGRMGPQNESSSIFNDDRLNVSYDIEECEQSGNGKISAPVIACTGIFCGRTNEVELCGGDLWVSSLEACGAVGQTLSVTGEVGVTGSATGAETVVASVFGQPLSPEGSPFVIEPASSKSFNASATCVSKGRHVGTVTASSGGQGLLDENINILDCECKPGHSDCDRTWASPHLITADGLAYDYYASGDYILQRIPGVDGIEVQGRFLPGFGVSWPQAAAIQVGPDVVEVHGDRLLTSWGNSHLLHVWVNGQRVAEVHEWQPFENQRYFELPGGGGIYIDQFIRRFGGGRVDPIALSVHWPLGGQSEGYGVRVAGLVFNQNEAAAYRDNPPIIEITLLRPNDPPAPERGMLGTHDGDPATDLARRNGQVIEFSDNMTWTELYAMFGGDWLARPYECLFRNGCIVPEFPTSAIQLDPAQEAFARAACYGLNGWYYEACVHDVGLLGQADIVQALYSNTDDLNEMADLIVQPGVEQPVFALTVGEIEVIDESVYRQPFTIEHVSGDGGWLLTIRPPRGSSARLISSGESSVSGIDELEDVVEVRRCHSDPYWYQAANILPEAGTLQLWARDSLSGGAGALLGEISLPETDACDFSLTVQPQAIEVIDGHDVELILGITEPVDDVVLDVQIANDAFASISPISVTVPAGSLQSPEKVLLQGMAPGVTGLTVSARLADISPIDVPVTVFDSTPPVVESLSPMDIHIGQFEAMEVLGSALVGVQVDIDHPGLVVSEVDNTRNDTLAFALQADESVPLGSHAVSLVTPSGDASVAVTVHGLPPDTLQSMPSSLEVQVQQPLEFDVLLNRIYYSADIELALELADDSMVTLEPRIASVPAGSHVPVAPFVTVGECPGETEVTVVTDFHDIAPLIIPVTVSQTVGPEIGMLAPQVLHIGAPMDFEIQGSGLCGAEVAPEHAGLTVLALDNTSSGVISFILLADDTVPLGQQTVHLTTSAGQTEFEIEIRQQVPRLLMNLEVLALGEDEVRTIALRFDQPHETDLAIELFTGDSAVASIDPVSLTIPAGTIAPIEEVLLQAQGAGATELQIGFVDYPEANRLIRPIWVGRQTDAIPTMSISAGGYHACAILSDQSAACWGGNWYGQAAPPEGEFIAISAGGYHNCGLRPDNRAMCWGDDRDGQSSPPAGQFDTISAGNKHTCALRLDGRAACWGDDSYDQSSPPVGEFVAIGTGWHHTCGLRPDGNVECWGRTRFGGGLPTPPEGEFWALSVGLEHNCALRSDGSAECWGRNHSGQSTPPDDEFASLSAGGWHNCAIRSDGSPVCWGDDWAGQATLPGGEFVAFSAGWEFTCGLRPDGAVKCWGWDDNGESSPPAGEFAAITTGGHHYCVHLPDGGAVCSGGWDGQSHLPDGEFLAVSAGERHTCGLHPDGSIGCWGRDSDGQSSPPDGEFIAISAGADHNCALRLDGTVACWGADWDGQSSPPEGEFIAVSAGGRHSCALRFNGSLSCWGGDWSGQATSLPGEFVSVSAGGSHTCALRTDGSAACWGDDTEGQSGAPHGQFVAISAGWGHTCALRPDASVVCWGVDWADQTRAPVGSYIAISAGDLYHTCALTVDRHFQCWGELASIGGPMLVDD